MVPKEFLQLIPFPETAATILAFFRSNHDGSSAVAGIIRERIPPCAMELMDRTAIDCVRKEAGLPVPDDAGCALLIEVDGPRESVSTEADRGGEARRQDGAIEGGRAGGAKGRGRLWTL